MNTTTTTPTPETPDSEFVGLFEGIESADYHSSPGLSFTGLKHLLQSPMHYKAYLAKPKKQTHAQKLGSLLHMALLEPEKFAATTHYCQGPLNTNPFKQDADKARAAGKEPIGKQMYEDIMGMRDSVLKHSLGSKYVASGKKELSAFYKDPETGVILRCRPDIWIEGALQIVDVKTCGNVQTFPMIELTRNQYHIQAAFYLMVMGGLMGRPLSKHVHLCVEDEYPYAAQVFELNDASLERAMLDIRNGIRTYARCLETNTWPGPKEVITATALPDWAWGYAPELEEIHE